MPGLTREAMELLEVWELLSSLSCGGALVIWMSIGSLSKTEAAEERAQRIMVILCFGAAISLFGFTTLEARSSALSCSLEFLPLSVLRLALAHR